MEQPTAIRGLHHIKLPVHDIEKSKVFYTDVMGFEYIKKFDHVTKGGDLFAVMLGAQHNGAQLLLELRKNPEQTAKQQYWDPITWMVPKRSDLEIWREKFEKNNVRCSKVFTAFLGWVLCALDPDEKFVRVYCEESHEWTNDVDVDDFWLRQ